MDPYIATIDLRRRLDSLERDVKAQRKRLDESGPGCLAGTLMFLMFVACFPCLLVGMVYGAEVWAGVFTNSDNPGRDALEAVADGWGLVVEFEEEEE